MPTSVSNASYDQAGDVREIEQPPRRHRLHDDASACALDERANDFDAAGRMAEPMPGNVEDYHQRRWKTA